MLLARRNSAEFWVQVALAIVGGSYLVHVGLLGFFIGEYDYDHLSGYYEIAWRFWQSGGGLPQFNPYLCGGRSLGADPQIPIFHPIVLLVPLLGPTWTLKIEMLFQLAVGVYGLHRWFGYLGISRLASTWGIFVFIAGGGIVARFLVGHSAMGYLFLCPALFYLHRRLCSPKAKARRQGRAFAAYLALFAYSALYKPNFAIYFLPTLLFEHAVWAILYRRPRAILLPLVAFAFAIAINGIVYYPAHRYFSDFPRFSETVQMDYSAWLIFPNLLLPLKAIPRDWFRGAIFGPHEYNLYVGPVVLGMALYLMFRPPARARREVISLTLFAVFCFVVGIGVPFPSVDYLFPFTWLSKFWPGFASVRVPSRFWFGCALASTVLATVALSSWRLSPRARNAILVLTLLPATLSAAVNLSRISLRSHQTQWTGRSVVPTDFVWENNEADRSYATIRAGKSALHCMYNMETYQSTALTPESLLKETTSKPAAVEAAFLDWSHIRLRVRGEPKNRIAFNFNHSPYWRFEGKGARIVSEFRSPLTLATDANAEGMLVFEQPGLRTGAWVSLASLLASAFLIYVVKFSMKMRSAGSGNSKRKTRE